MSKFNLINPKKITLENLPRIVGILLKQLNHLFNNLNDVNVIKEGISNQSVKDVDGVKLYPLSVADGKVSDVNGGKLHDTSISTPKYKAKSVPWDKMDNNRITDSFAWSLNANEEKTFYVEHETIYSFPGPPLIRAQGDSSGTYVYPSNETAFTFYGSNVAFYIRWYTAKGFMCVGHELSGSPRSGTLDWYRDGILNVGVS